VPGGQPFGRSRPAGLRPVRRRRGEAVREAARQARVPPPGRRGSAPRPGNARWGGAAGGGGPRSAAPFAAD